LDLPTLHTDEASGLIHRGPSDVYVWKEQRQYRTLDCKGRAVLDLGGHIGCFAKYALETLGAKKVTSVEPDPGNIFVFDANHSNDDRVTLIAGAVASGGVKSVDLQLAKTYSSKNRTDRAIRGREVVAVPAFDFLALLRKTRASVIKCDIEGAEYLLDWKSMPDRVHAIAMEYHHFEDAQLVQQHELHGTLCGMGFRPVDPGRVELGIQFQKVTTATYVR